MEPAVGNLILSLPAKQGERERERGHCDLVGRNKARKGEKGRHFLSLKVSTRIWVSIRQSGIVFSLNWNLLNTASL